MIALSENLLPQIERNPILEILSPPKPMEFDGMETWSICWRRSVNPSRLTSAAQ